MHEPVLNQCPPSRVSSNDECLAPASGASDAALPVLPWNPLRQYRSLFLLSVRRWAFSGACSRIMITLGLLPVFLIGLVAVIQKLNTPVINNYHVPHTELNTAFQMIFRTLYIHLIIFFGASIFGFFILRKEVDDRTLHFLFLQPVRKAGVILCRYAAFLAVTWPWLCLTFILSYMMLFVPFGLKALSADLFVYGRALTLIRECLVMLLALALYAAVFMVAGSLFKTSWFIVVFYLWDTGVAYLPSFFKLFTISHYLQAVTPEKSALPTKLFELISQAPSPLQSLLTLGFMWIVLISMAIIVIRQYECRYSGA